MVQESLVEYINAQTKLGVSRDAIKTTLIGAGWQASDVEDTLKKVEAAKASQPIATAAAAGTAGASVASLAAKPMDAMSSTPRIVTPISNTSNPAPQTIKMSDLVSSSAAGPASTTTASTPAASTTKSMGTKSPMTGPAAKPSMADTYQATSFSAPVIKSHGSRGALIVEIVLGIIALAAIAFGGFLYMQNGSLTSQLASLKGQSTGVNSQLSALQAQVAASTTALTAQVASLSGETQELQTELSFYVATASTTAGGTSTATLEGVAFAGKSGYVISAAYGSKIFVVNSKSASVIAALTPLMAGTSTPATTAQFTGTYVPGSDSITLTAVNGAAVQ